jgi:hypothetical protein
MKSTSCEFAVPAFGVDRNNSLKKHGFCSDFRDHPNGLAARNNAKGNLERLH